MKKFLVTGANGDIGEAVGRILIDDFPNAEINGADCAGDLPGSFIFKEMISAPSASDTKYEGIVHEWTKTYDLIIPTTEPEIKKITSLFQDNNSSPFFVLTIVALKPSSSPSGEPPRQVSKAAISELSPIASGQILHLK